MGAGPIIGTILQNMAMASPTGQAVLNARNQARQLDLAERAFAHREEQDAFDQRIREADMNYRLATNPALRPVESGTYETTMPSPGGAPANAMQAIEALRSGGPITEGPAAGVRAFQAPEEWRSSRASAPATAADVSKVLLAAPDTTTTRAPVARGRTVSWGGNEYQVLTPAEAITNSAEAERIRRQILGTPVDTSDIGGGVVYMTPGEATNYRFRRTQEKHYQAVEEAERNKRSTPSPHLQGYVNYETGDVTPAAVMFDESGIPALRTGAPARGIAKPRPRADRSTGGGNPKPAPKPSRAALADELTEQILRDSAAGGGQTVEDAIRNVDEHYSNDPRFDSGLRLQVRARLRTFAKENGKKNPYAKPRAAVATGGAPANPYR